MCRRIALGFLGVVVVALAGLAYVYFDITHKPARRGHTVPVSYAAAPSADEQRSAEAAAERLRTQLRAISPAAAATITSPAPPAAAASPQPPAPAAVPTPSGVPAPTAPSRFELHLSDSDVNALVAGTPDVRASLAKSKIEDLHLRFEPGQIVVEAMVPVVNDTQARISAAGRIWAQDGKLQYETRSVSLGSFPAPGLKPELDRQLKSSIARLGAGLAERVDEVEIRTGELVVRGPTAGG